MDCYSDSAYINNWDGHHDNIQSAYFVNGVQQSVHDNGKEDRRWQWRYCKESSPAFISQFSLPQTSYDATYHMDCADYNTHSAMIGATSDHSNYNEDRQWRWYCGALDTSKYMLTDCYDTGYINAWDQTFAFYCPSNGVIRKVYSYHDNGKEDRRWGFYCCRITNTPTPSPTKTPTPSPTPVPTTNPTASPSTEPTTEPSMEPTPEPTIEPTIHLTDDPTVNPTVHPTSTPTISPTTEPTNIPTNHPTSVPTMNPTHNPTANPTIGPSVEPTKNPIDPTDHTSVPTSTLAPAPTLIPTATPTTDPTESSLEHIHNLTMDHTDDPTVDETNVPTDTPTNNPTHAPTMNPTDSPFVDPTSTPTSSPLTKPSTNKPTQTPTSRKTLHFVCIYNDDKDVITTYLSLSMYGDIMVDAIILSLELSNDDSIGWFIMCNVFNTALSNRDSDCPSYSDSESKDDDWYLSIGMFDIVADNALNQYQQWIIDIMTSDNFKEKFTQNMNQKLKNSTGNRRRLLEYNSFSAINIYIIDPLNHTISTTEYDDEDGFGNNDNDNSLTIGIICVICALFVLIVLGSLIYVKRNRQKHKIAIPNAEHNYDQIKQNLEMEGTTQGLTQNIHLGDGEAHTEVIDDESDACSDDIDALVKAVNQTLIGDIDCIGETYRDTHENEDHDVIKAVNETHMHASK